MEIKHYFYDCKKIYNEKAQWVQPAETTQSERQEEREHERYGLIDLFIMKTNVDELNCSEL